MSKGPDILHQSLKIAKEPLIILFAEGGNMASFIQRKDSAKGDE